MNDSAMKPSASISRKQVSRVVSGVFQKEQRGARYKKLRWPAKSIAYRQIYTIYYLLVIRGENRCICR
jgi:hypothetical protein